MDVALLLLATAGSVMPVLWRSLRDLPLSVDDLLYSFVLIKYYGLFRVFRASIVTVRQVTVCLWLSMASAVLVAVVALLQVLNLFGVPDFLLDILRPALRHPRPDDRSWHVDAGVGVRASPI